MYVLGKARGRGFMCRRLMGRGSAWSERTHGYVTGSPRLLPPTPSLGKRNGIADRLLGNTYIDNLLG